LYNREILGYSAGPHKNAALVKQAFASVTYNLQRFELFHTDRGSEYKNQLIDEALEAFHIQRSLSTLPTFIKVCMEGVVALRST
jgi:putative transposase